MKTQAQEGKAWVSYSFLATVWNNSILHKVRTDHPLTDNEASIISLNTSNRLKNFFHDTEPGISTDIMWILLSMWSIMQLILTIFACVLQRSLCCSWICWQTPLPSRPAEKNHQNKDIQWRKILIYTLLLKSSLRLECFRCHLFGCREIQRYTLVPPAGWSTSRVPAPSGWTRSAATSGW